MQNTILTFRSNLILLKRITPRSQYWSLMQNHRQWLDLILFNFLSQSNRINLTQITNWHLTWDFHCCYNNVIGLITLGITTVYEFVVCIAIFLEGSENR